MECNVQQRIEKVTSLEINVKQSNNKEIMVFGDFSQNYVLANIINKIKTNYFMVQIIFYIFNIGAVVILHTTLTFT